MAQAQGRHYSTFSFYTPQELRAATATFLARLPGPEVCWVDEHLLVIAGASRHDQAEPDCPASPANQANQDQPLQISAGHAGQAPQKRPGGREQTERHVGVVNGRAWAVDVKPDVTAVEDRELIEVDVVGNTTAGVLSVSDGTHTAEILLLGNYTKSSFVASSDGSGGTIVVDPTRRPSPPAFAAAMAAITTGERATATSQALAHQEALASLAPPRARSA